MTRFSITLPPCVPTAGTVIQPPDQELALGMMVSRDGILSEGTGGNMGLSSTPRELQAKRVEGIEFHRLSSKHPDDGLAAQLQVSEDVLAAYMELRLARNPSSSQQRKIHMERVA